ncbi:putative HD phosphohydrolase [Neorhizobium huautlense]|uniref:HD phosphohydrolase n=1 Tax=Neorhizobium huautlense TaxID=67774 RepID=A0ABT9Q1M6_9HYPH|nr:putative HD phosphohydrolase [Neorhizobium huautlense]
MDTEDLKTACRRFEKEHGVEAFLDAMAELMTERMAVQGLKLRFFDDNDQRNDEQTPYLSRCLVPTCHGLVFERRFQVFSH